MPETLIEMARRLCSAYILSCDADPCKACPLNPYSPCASAAALPDLYHGQAQVIRDWAAAHPPKEKAT